jgi:hypothetical protein
MLDAAELNRGALHRNCATSAHSWRGIACRSRRLNVAGITGSDQGLTCDSAAVAPRLATPTTPADATPTAKQPPTRV